MTKKQPGNESTQTLKWFEIVNWKRAQPTLRAKNNDWLKFYTSLLDHDGYAGLDDSSRVLLSMLWAYAARTGHHILPIDPKWLWRQLPILNSQPDLKPLLEAKDIYGHPTPFLRLCGPPKPDRVKTPARDETKQPAAGSGPEQRDDKSARKPRKKANRKPARRPAAETPAIDPLFADALGVLETAGYISKTPGYISTRAIKRELKIGHQRAVEIVKSLVTAGLAGDYVRGKGRVLLRALAETTGYISKTPGYISTRAISTKKRGFQAQNADLGDSLRATGQSRLEESRLEESRLEEKRRKDPAPLRASDLSREERKSLAGFSKEEQTQSIAEQSSPEHTKATADQSRQEPEKPENPHNPTNSDAGAAKGHHVPRPPRSASRRPEAIGAVVGRRFQPWWGDQDCEAFGWEIAGALGYSVDRLNVESRNQWGVFAAWWWRLRQAAPAAVQDELRAKAKTKADEIRVKRRGHVKNPGAVWVYIMDRERASHGVRLPDDRAGPEAANI